MKLSPISKPVKYQASGGGRDSYIIADSGGFYKPSLDQVLPRVGVHLASVDPSLSPKKDRNPPLVGQA